MNHSIDSQALDLMLRAGSRWVLWLLIGLSIAATAVVLERLWFFARSRRQRQHIVDMLAALRKSGPEAARNALGDARSIEAVVARACLDHITDGALAIEEHIAAVIETDRLHYVLGLVRAFHDLATSAAMGSQAVMAGIAEALVATAIGLLVALPAVATYNALMRHVETAMAAANAVGHQILAYVKAPKPEAAASSGTR